MFQLLGVILIYSFFTFKSHQQSKKSVHKEKLQSRELHVCAQQMTFSAILLLNEIKASKFINNPHSKQDPRS